ncbi:adenylate kinase family enzyme [Devosia sp. UYZn731]|uniref:AAA family ATPase n=1 Tax=Devosia sp. UYZn731 TaxID=3156345 RepID=UPI003390DCF9
MQTFPPLASLGTRIVILGPSNSGKSTLAVALGNALDVPAIHLDRLRHLPNTNWQARSNDDFAKLHDEAILAPGWVMEGSYSKLAPQRLRRATGIIVVTDGLMTRYRRYFHRTLFQSTRVGALDGGQDTVNWTMISWLWKSRNAASKYRSMAQASGLPHVFVNNQSKLNRLYADWGLAPVRNAANRRGQL